MMILKLGQGRDSSPLHPIHRHQLRFERYQQQLILLAARKRNEAHAQAVRLQSKLNSVKIELKNLAIAPRREARVLRTPLGYRSQSRNKSNRIQTQRVNRIQTVLHRQLLGAVNVYPLYIRQDYTAAPTTSVSLESNSCQCQRKTGQGLRRRPTLLQTRPRFCSQDNPRLDQTVCAWQTID